MINVFLITIDCLRADHLSCMGYSRETTPIIDKIAQEGTLYKQAIAQGPNSSSSIPAILTSTYPIMFDGYRSLSDYRTVISELLEKSEILTAAFHSNPYFSEYYGYDRGFRFFNDFLTSGTKRRQEASTPVSNAYRNFIRLIKKTFGKNLFVKSKTFQKFRRTSGGKTLEKLIGAERVPTADKITSRALNWLEDHKSENLFLWTHYMDAHEPTMPPKKFLKIFNRSPNILDSTGVSERILSDDITSGERKNLLQGLIDLYDAEIRFIDYHIGKFLEKLKNLGLLEDSLIIITADHGEEFFEHGGMAHGALYDEVINVPLIVFSPSSEGKVIENQVELLDIAPTVLDFFDMESPEEYQGTSLFRLNNGESDSVDGVVSEVLHEQSSTPSFTLDERRISYRTDKWKLILDKRNERRELYNISQDPKERENVYSERKDKAEELETKIKGHIREERNISKEITTKKEKLRIKNKIKNLK